MRMLFDRVLIEVTALECYPGKLTASQVAALNKADRAKVVHKVVLSPDVAQTGILIMGGATAFRGLPEDERAEIEPGLRVLYLPQSAQHVEFEGKPHDIVRDTDILAVL